MLHNIGKVPKEILSLHTGHCGIQVGLSCWEHYINEHCLLPDGYLSRENASYNDLLEYNTIFEEHKCGAFRPRAILLDTDPELLGNIPQGKWDNQFGNGQLVSGNDNSAHIFAKGYRHSGKKIIDASLENIRRKIEECNQFQGFMIYHALGGGTGSGFSCLLMEKLRELYKKKSIHEYSTLPEINMTSSTVDIYNMVLSVNSTLKNSDCNLMFDNDIVYHLTNIKFGIDALGYLICNKILARVISAVTSSMRFPSALNVNLKDFETSLIPIPRVCFPLVSFSPIMPRAKFEEPSVQEMTINCFNQENQFLKCNLKQGKLMASCLLYSGNVKTAEVNRTVSGIRQNKEVTFVDWCPPLFKAGFNIRPTHRFPKNEIAIPRKQLCMLSNSTAIVRVFQEMKCNFNKLFNKKAFFHWYYQEGMEEIDFEEARENLELLESDYKDTRNGQY